MVRSLIVDIRISRLLPELAHIFRTLSVLFWILFFRCGRLKSVGSPGSHDGIVNSASGRLESSVADNGRSNSEPHAKRESTSCANETAFGTPRIIFRADRIWQPGGPCGTSRFRPRPQSWRLINIKRQLPFVGLLRAASATGLRLPLGYGNTTLATAMLGLYRICCIAIASAPADAVDPLPGVSRSRHMVDDRHRISPVKKPRTDWYFHGS